MKPQRPSPEVKTTPAECINITYIHSIHKEHPQTSIQHRNAGKTALFILTMENA
jgi:hypothetical protein